MSSFTIPEIPDSSKGFTVTFDFEISDGKGTDADAGHGPAGEIPGEGFSFNYGNFKHGELGNGEEGYNKNGKSDRINV